MPGGSQGAFPLLQAIESQLVAAGIDSARSDARCLLGLALARDEPVLPHEDLGPLDAAAQARLDALTSRRLAGEPISRIRGWREFWSLRFDLSPATLDPRPDSETLVAAASDWAKTCDWAKKDATGEANRGGHLARCLDLGTGSGCLLLAFLSEIPSAAGIGLDINRQAVAMARHNAARLGLAPRAEFRQHDFTTGLAAFGQFDVILSNPPYIPRDEIAGLAPDVRLYDPMPALDGGEDGLALWRGLMPQLASALATDGAAFVEVGAGQDAAVSDIAAAAGLSVAGHFADLAGITRCLQFVNKV
jgi:release factor glutamine methyltransferase